MVAFLCITLYFRKCIVEKHKRKHGFYVVISESFSKKKEELHTKTQEKEGITYKKEGKNMYFKSQQPPYEKIRIR